MMTAGNVGMPAAVWSFTSTSVIEKVPVPDHVRAVPLTEDRIRMSLVATSSQAAPLALKLIVPLFETLPESVRSPVPRLLQVAPEATEATAPLPFVVRFEEVAPVP